jgi:hypothetical protein
VDWIDLVQDRDQWRALVNMIMNSWVPQNIGKFLSTSVISGFSRVYEFMIRLLPCKMSQFVTFLNCILVIPHLNLALGTGYSELSVILLTTFMQMLA